MARKYVRLQDKLDQLASLHQKYPEGFTYQDVEDEFGWGRMEFAGVVNYVRKIYHDRDYNLVCEPQGFGQPWLYRFTSDPNVARPWLDFRQNGLESGMQTACSVAHSLVQATTSDTLAGKRVRKVERTLTYLMDELADLKEPVPAA